MFGSLCHSLLIVQLQVSVIVVIDDKKELLEEG